MFKKIFLIAIAISFSINVYADTYDSAHCPDITGWVPHIRGQHWELTEKSKNYGWRVNRSLENMAYDSFNNGGNLRVDIDQAYTWGNYVKSDTVTCKYFGPLPGKLVQGIYTATVNRMTNIKHDTNRTGEAYYQPSPVFSNAERAFTRFGDTTYVCSTFPYSTKNCYWEWNVEATNELPTPTAGDSDWAHCPLFNTDFRWSPEKNKWELSRDAVNRGWQIQSEGTYQALPRYRMHITMVGSSVDCTLMSESDTTAIVTFHNAMGDYENNLYGVSGCYYPADQAGQCTWQWKGFVD